MENPAKILRRMTPTLVEQMLCLFVSAFPSRIKDQCLRCCYVLNTKELSCRNVISSFGRSTKNAFSLNESWKHTPITFTLHRLAAGADFE